MNTPTTFTVNIPALIWFKTCYLLESHPQTKVPRYEWCLVLGYQEKPYPMKCLTVTQIGLPADTGQVLLLNPARPHSWMTKGVRPFSFPASTSGQNVHFPGHIQSDRISLGIVSVTYWDSFCSIFLDPSFPPQVLQPHHPGSLIHSGSALPILAFR